MVASSGYSPIIFENFESMATRPSAEKIDKPLLITAQNIRFIDDDLMIRPGLTFAFSGPDGTKNVTSLAQLTLASGSRVQLGFDSGGSLFREDTGVITAGIGNNLYAQTATAQHRAYVAFSDLQTGQAAPKVYHRAALGPNIGQFFLDGIGLSPNSTPVGAGVASADAGDIATGDRYCVVLFKTRTGYIGGYSNLGKFKVTVSTSNKSLSVTGVPVGPANCVARVLAFTQANASSDGPFFAVEADDFISGLNRAVNGSGNNITSTIINDNTTSSITVSFPDEYLISGLDVTDYADKIAIASQKHVFYSETLDRMFWCGEDADTWRVSEPSDFETVFGTTGLIQPAYGNDGIAQLTLEYRNETYLLKDNGGHVVVPNGDTPSEWSTWPRWKKIGPCGPRAADAGNEFMAFAHKSGLYIYEGTTPVWVAYNMTGRKTDVCWDNINWNYKHLVYVFIDEDSKTVRVGVPMGSSTSVNVEFVVDYSRGWDKTRWSYDVKSAAMVLKVERVITSPNVQTPTDNRVATSQILVASGAGKVLFEDPSSVTDDGAAIDQRVRLAYTPYQKDPGIYQIGAIDLTAGGEGNLNVTVHPRQDVAQNFDPIELAGPDSIDHDNKVQGQNERWSIELWNGNTAGAWFNLQRVIVWVQLVWKTRTI